MAKLTEEQLEELRETFEYNDLDADGMIELDEFLQMLQELEADTSEREARIGFQEIDTNDDGLIDFEEFIDWWTED
ncbi:MAG TPA: EF-hand domain-containing protein [Gammaproteobacteria bacterium]|nr:EF-hand domain-containing protein [Gammaproteobacteria bacterium]